MQRSVGQPLVDFWSEMGDDRHPQDVQALSQYPHKLQLGYPPPAYIGNVKQARVFILYANGGYDSEERTPQELANLATPDEYRRRLRESVACDGQTHPYWARPNRLWKWLQEGRAAIVNAMAYRSPSISKEPENGAIAEKLPSVLFHRKWLREHALPATGKNGGMVVAHRRKLWEVSQHEGTKFFLITKNPQSSYLPNEVSDKIEEFLAG